MNRTRGRLCTAVPLRSSRKAWLLLLIWVALPASASADETAGSFLDLDRNMYFWLKTSQGEDIGDQPGYTAAGATAYRFDWHGAWLGVGQGMMTNHVGGATNVGLVRRNYLFEDSLVGLGFWYDGYQSERGNWFNQISGSFEWFRDDGWTLRANGFFPLGPRQQRLLSIDQPGGGPGIGEVGFRGNVLVTGEDILRRHLDEYARSGADVEVAAPLGGWSTEAYAAYYHLQGGGPRVDGARGGVRGYVTPRLAANLTLSYDRIYGANLFGGFTWFIGGSGGNAPVEFHDKLITPVQRREQIVITRQITEELVPNVQMLTDQGTPITLVHVRQGAPGTNAGTFENPFNRATLPATSTANIVYVHADGTYTNGYTLAPGQRLLGEGDGAVHLVMTDQLGWIQLPEGSGGASRPIVQGMLVAADGGEISNFHLQPATVGIQAPGIANRLNINRTRISGGGNAVEILGGTGRIDLTAVAIDNPSDLGLGISGGSTDVRFGSPVEDPEAGLYGASSITQSTSGTALFIRNGHSGSFTQAAGSAIDASSNIGLHFENADGNYDFAGPVTLTGTGTAIGIVSGSQGTFRFAETDIINPLRAGLDIRNSSPTVDYLDGSIVTTGVDPAVSIAGGSGDVNVAAEITNTAGRSVVVQGRTGGAVNLSGNITDSGSGILVSNNTGGATTFSGTSKVLQTGANSAVTLASNPGHTINFTGGGLDITTSGNVTAFVAEGGGTVNVTGPNNRINTTDLGGTGTALRVSNVAIGAENLVFRSITVDGAANAIVLNNTGTAGGLKVTGDGSATRNASGGVLRNTTGDAVWLTNTANVELDHLMIVGAVGRAVFGRGISDGSGGMEPSFAFRHGTIQNQGTAAGHHALAFDTPDATNVTGSMVVDNVLFRDFGDNGLAIANAAGSLAIRVTNSAFDTNRQTPAPGSGGGEAIAVRATGTADLTLNVVENTFREIAGTAAILVGTADSADACLNLVGNHDGSNGPPGTIALEIGGASSQTITQASIAELSSDNHGAPVTVSGTGTLNFNGDCSDSP